MVLALVGRKLKSIEKFIGIDWKGSERTTIQAWKSGDLSSALRSFWQTAICRSREVEHERSWQNVGSNGSRLLALEDNTWVKRLFEEKMFSF